MGISTIEGSLVSSTFLKNLREESWLMQCTNVQGSVSIQERNMELQSSGLDVNSMEEEIRGTVFQMIQHEAWKFTVTAISLAIGIQR